MNERIRELAEQATTRTFDGTGTDVGKLVLDEQKFAQLIVQECCSIAENQRLKVIENPDDPSWTEHFVDVQTNIKNKFGIYF